MQACKNKMQKDYREWQSLKNKIKAAKKDKMTLERDKRSGKKRSNGHKTPSVVFHFFSSSIFCR